MRRVHAFVMTAQALPSANALLIASFACLPSQWEARPGGQLHDTLKPLAANRLDLRSTLLIDNEAHKGASGEEANMIALPTWEHCTGGGPWGVQDDWGGAVCIVLPRSLRHPIFLSLG